MRALGLLFFFWSSVAFCHTFVFQSGKHIEGTILFEDQGTIRIADKTGVAMSLNKGSLDFEAMETVNRPLYQIAVVVELNEVPAEVDEVEQVPPPPIRATGLQEENQPAPFWKARMQRTQRDYKRLQQECRNAGARRTGKERLETHVYLVNGKRIAVTGYWADPENIASAKETCRKALEAQAEFIQAKKSLEENGNIDASNSSS